MTTPFSTSKAEGVFVRVSGHRIIRAAVQGAVKMEGLCELVVALDISKHPIIKHFPLPLGFKPGNSDIFFAVSDLTEEQCAEIADKGDYGTFEDYRTGGFEFITAKESFLSLMDSLGLPREGNYVVLVKTVNPPVQKEK
jgi:hypothetical protein